MFDYDPISEAVIAGDLERAPVGPARLHWAAWDDARNRLQEDVRPAAEARAVRLSCRQGFVLTHQQARMCGMTRARIRQLVRGRAWTASRHGVLSPLPPGDGSGKPAGDDIEIRSTAAALVRPGMVISHDCGAAVDGLPLLRPPGRVALTATWRPAACNWPDVVIRVAALPEEDCERWFGAPVTSVARTVVDLSRHSSRAGIIAADAALRERLLSVRSLNAAIDRQRGWPGITRARVVASLADPRPESPLESLTRLFLQDWGIPLPEPQQWVVGLSGRRYRVDGLWSDRAVILEMDGMVKYRTEDVLRAEKKREMDLERAGYYVVRITWSELHQEPDLTVARILYALRVGGRRAVRP